MVEGLPAIRDPRLAARPNGSPLTVGVRPEHLDLASDGWPLKVDVVEQLGGISYLYGQVPSGERLVVAVPGQTDARAGATVKVAARSGSLHFFDAATAGEPSLAS
jgi:ABC-type sugar transport system ATPase subunit